MTAAPLGEPGKQLRLRALASGGADDVVPELGVLRVQPRTVYGPRHAPLPETAALSVGDVVWIGSRGAGSWSSVKLVGETAERAKENMLLVRRAGARVDHP